MELIWFNWKTNIDYKDMLDHPIHTTDEKINRSAVKRKLSRLKRNRKRRNKRKH